MANALVDGDLLLVDDLHPVTLLQKDTAGVEQSTAIAKALRRNIPTIEAAASGGRYQASDTRIHFQTEDATPRVADRITDNDGNTYTVLEARYDTLASRWRCITRNLTVHYGLYTDIEVQLGNKTRNSSGVQEPTWKTVARVTASITELNMESEGESEKSRFAERTYQVILQTDEELSPLHRIVDSKGNTYQIESSANKDNIANLQQATCRMDPYNKSLGS